MTLIGCVTFMPSLDSSAEWFYFGGCRGYHQSPRRCAGMIDVGAPSEPMPTFLLAPRSYGAVSFFAADRGTACFRTEHAGVGEFEIHGNRFLVGPGPRRHCRDLTRRLRLITSGSIG
jgi:hypothetical protein